MSFTTARKPDETPARARGGRDAVKDRVPAWALAAVMGASGAAHFLVPRSYEAIVPRFLGAAGVWVQLSGAAELACAALLVPSRTRRLGAWLSVGILIAVFPANVQMALDGGVPGKSFPLGSAVVAWLRVPLQVPLVLWARGVAIRAGRAGQR